MPLLGVQLQVLFMGGVLVKMEDSAMNKKELCMNPKSWNVLLKLLKLE
jgi:hypothetical protein